MQRLNTFKNGVSIGVLVVVISAVYVLFSFLVCAYWNNILIVNLTFSYFEKLSALCANYNKYGISLLSGLDNDSLRVPTACLKVLFVLMYNVPIYIFSFISGRSHCFPRINQYSGKLMCLAQDPACHPEPTTSPFGVCCWTTRPAL